MYELNKVSDNTYYLSGPTKIGIYVCKDNSAYLIDSGNDKSAGKSILKVLEENNWILKAIINTHSHADHIGGNKFLQEKTGCKIFAKGIESSFINHPILEPCLLYGGNPHTELKHKFLYAQESHCDDITSPDFPSELSIIDLKGHSPEMIGIKTPDNILFAADSVSSPIILVKYGISYIYNVKEYLETLENLTQIEADLFIPSHADVCNDINEIVNINKEKVFEIISKILDFLKEPCSFEALLMHIFDAYSLTMTHEQHSLLSSTLKSYLTYLFEENKISIDFVNNNCIYKSI